MLYLNETKKMALQYFKEEVHKEQLNSYFTNSITCLNSNIDILLEKCSRLVYKEIKRQLVPQLFK